MGRKTSDEVVSKSIMVGVADRKNVDVKVEASVELEVFENKGVLDGSRMGSPLHSSNCEGFVYV